MRLANDFSWSFSRRNTFEECPKKYWYTYYGSWEGWPKTPYDKRPSIDPLASYLYALKQMQSIPTFVGTVVHNTIEHFLKAKRPFQEEALQKHALRLFETGLEEAKNETWKKSPKKHTNLFEIYYGKGIDEGEVQRAKEKIASCLANWYRSPIVQELIFHSSASVVSVEALEFFQLAELYKIIVVIDLALIWKGKQDTYILFDWKTGDESEKTEEQLYCYAIFANKVWKAPLERVILAPYYLFKNAYYKIGAGQERTLDLAKVQAAKEGIITSCKKLSVLHQEQDPRNFPYTENRSKCVSCPFKEVCEGAGYKELSKEELKAMIT